MNFNIINFFPTTAYVGQIENHRQYKEDFYKVYPKFDYDENECNNTVSENVGNPLIHLEDDLNPLFESIVDHIKNYTTNILNLKDIFNIVITKTWLSRSRNSKNSIPWHIHSTSHISFVYYANIPPNSHAIQFSNDNEPNNLFLGMNAEHRKYERQLIQEFNNINCQTFFISPNEGDVIIFPSKTKHSTKSISDDFVGERLAIVGDVTLTLKEEYLSYSMGYIDPKYWKSFSSR